MARAVLVVTDLGPQRAQAISAIRQASTLSIGEILNCVKSETPVVELGIHGVDLRDRLQQFRGLAKYLSDVGATVIVYELLEGERLSDLERSALVKLDLDMLENRVASLEDERRHREAVEPIREDEEFN